MKTTKHFVLLICILSLVLSLSLIATAEEIQPFGLPTISSTTCRTCFTQMVFQESTYEYQTVLVQPSACPNTSWIQSESMGPHEHEFELRYDLYECPNCAQWGWKLAYKTMISCEAGLKK